MRRYSVFVRRMLQPRLCFTFDEFGPLALELCCLPFDLCVAALDIRAYFVALFLPVRGCFVVSRRRGVVRRPAFSATTVR